MCWFPDVDVYSNNKNKKGQLQRKSANNFISSKFCVMWFMYNNIWAWLYLFDGPASWNRAIQYQNKSTCVWNAPASCIVCSKSVWSSFITLPTPSAPWIWLIRGNQSIRKFLMRACSERGEQNALSWWELTHPNTDPPCFPEGHSNSYKNWDWILRLLLIDWLTPTDNPHSTGRPMNTPLAPSAIALKTSRPLRIPPSIKTWGKLHLTCEGQYMPDIGQFLSI